MCNFYKQVPIRDAFVEEFKIVINFNKYTRELKSSASVYSRSRNSSMSIETASDDQSNSEDS